MEKLNYFSKKKPIIGICAGMVILSSNTNKSIFASPYVRKIAR